MRSTAPPASTPRTIAGEGCSYADNRDKLLAELDGVDDRRAAFKTVAIVVWPDGRELLVEGVCPGVITTEERGAVGFGYDSVFVPDEGDGRDVRRDGLRGEARHLAPRSGVQGAAGRAGATVTTKPR